MSSSSSDESPAELKEQVDNKEQECSLSKSSQNPRWVGQVQKFFKDKQKETVRDIFGPLREQFKIFDRANTGTLCKDEFLEALSTSGVDVKRTTLGELDSLFESFDIAGNGIISISEFVSVLGTPLIQNPNVTVDDIFKETVKIMLMKGNSKDVLNRQWQDICGRVGVDPQRGTLTFENFKEMMVTECDWCLNMEQLYPIFNYLDMNSNGIVSIITMRIMVSEMADCRSKGRTLMVIDLLKQAMTNAQADLIRKQATTIQRLNDELVEEHNTLKELEKYSPHKHACHRPHFVQPNSFNRRTKKVTTKSVGSAFFSWPLLSILSWVTNFILFIITFFAAPPEGDFGVDLYGVIIFGLVISIFGVMYNIMVWPVVHWQDGVSLTKAVCSMTFGIAAPTLFGLVVAFMNPFWYTDIDCFSCKACGNRDEPVCYGDWDVIGGWQNTCPCALDDEELWDNAKFLLDADLQDCNATLDESNYFEGDFNRLKPCMFYSNGMFMRLGFGILVATVFVMGSSCWGCFKDLHLWVKSTYQIVDSEIENPIENELTNVDFSG